MHKPNKTKNEGIFYLSLTSLSQRVSRHLSQLHLPDLSAARNGYRAGNTLFAKYEHVLRCLVSTEGLTRPRSKVIIRGAGLTRSNLNESSDHFAVFLVRNADDGGQLDVWVCRQALLNLEGVDILATCASQSRKQNGGR